MEKNPYVYTEVQQWQASSVAACENWFAGYVQEDGSFEYDRVCCWGCGFATVIYYRIRADWPVGTKPEEYKRDTSPSVFGLVDAGGYLECAEECKNFRGYVHASKIEIPC